MVCHSNGKNELFRLDPNDNRILKTNRGEVNISVYDPHKEDDTFAYESVNVTIAHTSTYVTIEENCEGKPTIITDVTRKNGAQPPRANRRQAKVIHKNQKDGNDLVEGKTPASGFTLV